jgi:hypothetical protein
VAGINLPLNVFADFHFIGKALFTTDSRRRRRTAKPKISKAYNRKVRKERPLRTAKKTERISEAGNEKGALAALSFSSAGVTPAFLKQQM